jgi:hypothetical protein
MKLAERRWIAGSQCFKKADCSCEDDRGLPEYSEMAIVSGVEIRPMVMLNDDFIGSLPR